MFFAKKQNPAPALKILVYAIEPKLWRWEIRSSLALLRCGTAKTESDAHLNVMQELNR